MASINPEKLYRISDAAKLIPSSHRSGHITTACLRNWARSGKVKSVERKVGARIYLFIAGSELLRILAPETVKLPEPKRQRAKRLSETEKRARDLGIL